MYRIVCRACFLERYLTYSAHIVRLLEHRPSPISNYFQTSEGGSLHDGRALRRSGAALPGDGHGRPLTWLSIFCIRKKLAGSNRTRNEPAEIRPLPVLSIIFELYYSVITAIRV